MTDERRKRELPLQGIYLILQTAPRLGGDKDNLEGARYIQISETLVNQMIKNIEIYVVEGYEGWLAQQLQQNKL
jgi:hypothetical protein